MVLSTSSPLLSGESLFLSKNVGRQDKEKRIINDEGEKLGQKGAMGDEGNAMDSMRAKRGRVLVENIDEISKVKGSEDVDKLRSENKVLRSKLALVEDARHQAEFKATKA
ncbi:Uncharacterized protein Fot_41670 [Forsythia ovata]|uniref:Uncharacterized protein n=1 Tax=Forsythia ovata TaxID=205694 RepID=A0ABD1RKQ7_9LAMI